MTNADPPRRSLTVLTGATFLLASEFLAATAAAACMHPHISGLNSRERQRDMLAQADRQRLARQVSELARSAPTWQNARSGWTGRFASTTWL